MEKAPQPAYQISNVQDVSEYDPMRGQVRSKRVNYRLWDGTTSYVVIPLDKYTADEVRRELEAAAQKHSDITAIKGPPVYGSGSDPSQQATNPYNPGFPSAQSNIPVDSTSNPFG